VSRWRSAPSWRASGLRLAEVPIPLAELVNEGYVTTEQRPDERGGMERLYTRNERPVQESTIVREDDGPREIE
jgi:hypothetical protein